MRDRQSSLKQFGKWNAQQDRSETGLFICPLQVSLKILQATRVEIAEPTKKLS